MFNTLFNTPSRSYAQDTHRTPTKTNRKHPAEVPLPPSPSPPESAQKTPSLGIDHALASSPRTDTLVTPGRTLGAEGSTTGALTDFGLDTPNKHEDGHIQESKRGVPVLEDFELIRVVGKGCAGRVMMVRHTDTAKIQAMKAISKRSVLTYDELDHTLTEVRILKQFAKYEPNNPFIVRLNYAFMDKENIYFVMDFYPGGDLATQMEIGRLGHTRTRFYAVDITHGLLDLHRHGIIVRDLKPENVLLNNEGHAVLADFGLSKQFSYRGEPAAMTIPIYPGQPALPYWAGAGLGSVRTSYNGRQRVVIDRAESFVGTAEYIAPEVVKRAQYTYAVDCQLNDFIYSYGELELTEEVPFRQHPDEPPTMLWDQILLDSWQEIFHDRTIAELDLEEEKVDQCTLDFIDGKDPNYRLTEPCVTQHPFFYGIEWDLVAQGGYTDPSPLTLHPTPEYNLHYFPRLCLQEQPTVDMTEHDTNRPDLEDMDPLRKTPLNDPLTYAMEHRRAREAFRDFEWTREDGANWQHGESGEGRHSEIPDGRQEYDAPGYVYEGADDDEGEGGGGELEGDTETDGGMTLDWSVSEAAEDPGSVIQDLDMPAIPRIGSDLVNYDSESGIGPISTESVPTEDQARPGTPVDNDVVPASTVLPSTDQMPRHESGAIHTSPRLVDVASDKMANNETATLHSSPPPIEVAAPPLPPVASLSPEVLIPSSPKTIKVPSPRAQTKLRLPSGLPASGLSSSDIVSIPSPDPNSPTRLVRRNQNQLGYGHASRPSIDTVHTLAMANPRLSVDLHGTLSQLGDEDWEKLETTSIPSIPNAAPSAFFTRGFATLRRRPSAINTNGGFGRPHKNSNSSNSASGDSSPTKGNNRHQRLFTVKSIENTKKAFRTLKAFPRMISHSKPKSNQGEAKSTTPSRVNSPTSPPRDRYGPVSAPNTSIGTGSWFTNRRLGISRSFKPSRSNTTSSTSTGSSTRTSTYANPTIHATVSSLAKTEDIAKRQSGDGVPRVELTHSPPVDWDLSTDIDKPKESRDMGPAVGLGIWSGGNESESERERVDAEAPRGEVMMGGEADGKEEVGERVEIPVPA